jgi:hypothetical protein
MVFTGFRNLNRDATLHSRQTLGIDSTLADELARRFEIAERAELRRLFFEIDTID